MPWVRAIEHRKVVAVLVDRMEIVAAGLVVIIVGHQDTETVGGVAIFLHLQRVIPVLHESLPGFFVTANVYRPNQPGRYPGVLLQAGHTQEGKPEGQRLAANLALKGFVVLAFDPVGQGEREQTYDQRVDRPLAGWSVPEHIQAGTQSLLIGESVARYFIWDAKRAIDYLVSRPDVDAAHLGATGCSGGGALTTFMGALDPRLKAVAPACFINSYRLLFAGQDPDSEMSLPNLLSSGLDMADYVELSAPTPWLILATEGDYFTPAGARLLYEAG